MVMMSAPAAAAPVTHVHVEQRPSAGGQHHAHVEASHGGGGGRELPVAATYGIWDVALGDGQSLVLEHKDDAQLAWRLEHA